MCTERYINPFTDFGFKRLFGSSANRDFLISFLNSLFGDDDKIVDISYQNTQQFGFSPSDRAAVFDLYCVTKSGNHVIVEMQNAYQRYFLDRTIYYSSFPMQEVAKKGEWNYQLPKIYTVAFLNFRMPDFVEIPDYKHVICLADTKTGKVFYDKLTYIYIEMPKFDKGLDELCTPEDKWLYIIKNMNQMDSLPTQLNEEHFLRFFKMAEIQAFSKEERTAYETSKNKIHDYFLESAKEIGFAEGHARGLAEGRAECLAKGHAEGIAEGAHKEALRIASTLKATQVPIDVIAKSTGLSIQEIEEL